MESGFTANGIFLKHEVTSIEFIAFLDLAQSTNYLVSEISLPTIL